MFHQLSEQKQLDLVKKAPTIDYIVNPSESFFPNTSESVQPAVIQKNTVNQQNILAIEYYCQPK